VLSAISPDNSEALYTYDEGGGLLKVELKHRRSSTAQTVVGDITYNARGQREAVVYGSTSSPTMATSYGYDPEKYWININTAVGRGAEYIDEAALDAHIEAEVAAHPEMGPRANMWRSNQGQVGVERDVLFKGHIDPSAVEGKGIRTARGAGVALGVYGVIVTARDLYVATEESIEEESVMPVAAETIRQAGSWGMAWPGAKAGGSRPAPV
jgi:hypothetical protein